jgi:hypothetical protein
LASFCQLDLVVDAGFPIIDQVNANCALLVPGTVAWSLCENALFNVLELCSGLDTSDVTALTSQICAPPPDDVTVRGYIVTPADNTEDHYHDFTLQSSGAPQDFVLTTEVGNWPTCRPTPVQGTLSCQLAPHNIVTEMQNTGVGPGGVGFQDLPVATDDPATCCQACTTQGDCAGFYINSVNSVCTGIYITDNQNANPKTTTCASGIFLVTDTGSFTADNPDYTYYYGPCVDSADS